MIVACLDLEGVLVPEIWIQFSERTGIAELRRTTRDEPDYDKLMKWRIALLAEKGFTLGDIQHVIAGMAPLPGARELLDWLRPRMQVVILSDTFNQFAQPLMKQLGWPTLFCHDLATDATGRIVGYRLRQADAKREAVLALRRLNFRTVAVGDSYNDTRMLAEADHGVLFRPPENVVREFPQFPVARDYDQLRAAFERAEEKLE
jgi:phosphoserine/homoserine phosphotransferase